LIMLVLVGGFGCSPVLHQYPPLPHIDDPEHYLRTLAGARRADLTRLSGMLKLTVTGTPLKRTTRSIFFIEVPHFMRIEILGLFNQPSAYITADNDTLRLYHLDANTLYAGAASPDNIAAITGVFLTPGDIAHLLLGYPPVVGIDDATSITWHRARSTYVITITTADCIQTITVDPQGHSIMEYTRICAGRPYYTIDFADFSRHGSTLLPGRITVFHHATGLCAEATLSGVRTESFPHTVFLFNPPANARHLPLDALWERHAP
jgi:hypothetical protein